MKLYFENSNGQRRIVAKPNTEEEVYKEIYKFLEDRNFKSYYTRTWLNNDGEKIFDVGSWSEFFILSDN